MAENKLLLGGFYGKAGSMVGQKWKDKIQVHARVFSKSPPSQLQTDNVRAFECLNRLSSALAKKWWPWLGLSDKEMHKHNAIAKWLKPLIATHTFEPDTLRSIIPNDGLAEITSLEYNQQTRFFTLDAHTVLDVGTNPDCSWLVCVGDTYGNIFYCESPSARSISLAFQVPIEPLQSLFAFTMVSQKETKGFRISGLYYEDVPLSYDIEPEWTAYTVNDVTGEVVATGQIIQLPVAWSGSVSLNYKAINQLRWETHQVNASLQLKTDGTCTLVFNVGFDVLNQRLAFDVGSMANIIPASFPYGRASINILASTLSLKDRNRDIILNLSSREWTASGRAWAYQMPCDFALRGYSVRNTTVRTCFKDGSVTSYVIAPSPSVSGGVATFKIQGDYIPQTTEDKVLTTEYNYGVRMDVQGASVNWLFATVSEPLTLKAYNPDIEIPMETGTLSYAETFATGYHTYTVSNYWSVPAWRSVQSSLNISIVRVFKRGSSASTGVAAIQLVQDRKTPYAVITTSQIPNYANLDYVLTTSEDGQVSTTAVASDGVTQTLVFKRKQNTRFTYA